MRTIFLVLACVACAGHGRRLQISRQDEGRPESLKVFGALLRALEPTTGWQALASGRVRFPDRLKPNLRFRTSGLRMDDASNLEAELAALQAQLAALQAQSAAPAPVPAPPVVAEPVAPPVAPPVELQQVAPKLPEVVEKLPETVMPSMPELPPTPVEPPTLSVPDLATDAAALAEAAAAAAATEAAMGQSSVEVATRTPIDPALYVAGLFVLLPTIAFFIDKYVRWLAPSPMGDEADTEEILSSAAVQRSAKWRRKVAKQRSAPDIFWGGVDNLQKEPFGWFFSDKPTALTSTLPNEEQRTGAREAARQAARQAAQSTPDVGYGNFASPMGGSRMPQASTAPKMPQAPRGGQGQKTRRKKPSRKQRLAAQKAREESQPAPAIYQEASSQQPPGPPMSPPAGMPQMAPQAGLPEMPPQAGMTNAPPGSVADITAAMNQSPPSTGMAGMSGMADMAGMPEMPPMAGMAGMPPGMAGMAGGMEDMDDMQNMLPQADAIFDEAKSNAAPQEDIESILPASQLALLQKLDAQQGSGGSKSSMLEVPELKPPKMPASMQQAAGVSPQKTSAAPGQQAPAAPVMDDDSVVQRMMELKGILDDGLITQEEYDQKKQDIMGSI